MKGVRMSKQKDRPRYRGMKAHVDKEGGFVLWLPSDWRKIEMREGHQGVIFTPHEDRFDTCFMAEKHNLDYSVTEDDVPTLREGFRQGLESLPENDIEWQNEHITPTLKTFEARFTFLDDGQRRKRWVRTIYWAKGNLVLIAQGADPDEFEYWRPMFFNTMTTMEIR